MHQRPIEKRMDEWDQTLGTTCHDDLALYTV